MLTSTPTGSPASSIYWTEASSCLGRGVPGTCSVARAIERRSLKARELCAAPPAVNKTEPTKNVTASASAPTRLAYPGKGPIKKHVDPLANSNAIQRSRLIAAAFGGRG